MSDTGLSPPNPVLLLDDSRFDKHVAPGYHPERPERLHAARRALRALGPEVPWHQIQPREATAEELSRVHSPELIEFLSRRRGTSGFLDPDTYLCDDSVDAALLASGGLVTLVESLRTTPQRKGVALPRPPGHHATPTNAMGFCLINHVAVAAAHAVAQGMKRVLIVDYDVHHGNGTQAIFWTNPHVLYASLHQFPFYPGTGAVYERGEGDGAGYTVNVPLSAHGTDAVYRAAFEQVLLPIFHEYKPQLVLVSAGFDASARDPLAQMELTPEAFGWMTASLSALAETHAEGRIVLVLEGGYDLVALESGLAQAVRGLVFPDEILTASQAPSLRHPEVDRALKASRRYWAKTD